MSATKLSRCKSSTRHWFTYRGNVGSSAPTCQHFGCDVPNPNYNPDRDPYAGLSETIRRQDRGGLSGLPQVDPESNGGWGMVPCPDHPDTAAVDCIECEPVDTEPIDPADEQAANRGD